MKFSLITATWNSAKSISATQRSIGEQDFPREQLEWLVVDGASTDNTLELIGQFAFRPDRLVSERDRGIYDALNKGVTLATGDVIGFVHADDMLAHPLVLRHLADAFAASGADAVYGDLQYVRDASSAVAAISGPVVRHWISGSYDRRRLRWGWMPPHPSLYLTRRVYESAVLDNGEYFDTSFSCSADYDFMMRILALHNVQPVYLPEVLVKMLVGGVSNRSLKHVIRKSREDWRVIRRNRIGHLHTLAWKNLGKVRQFLHRQT